MPLPERLESPQENQISRISSREKEPVPERPSKKVSWPHEGELKKIREVSRWMSDEWGTYKNPVWENGKVVEACEWVKKNNVQTSSNPPAKESKIEVSRVEWINNGRNVSDWNRCATGGVLEL